MVPAAAGLRLARYWPQAGTVQLPVKLSRCASAETTRPGWRGPGLEQPAGWAGMSCSQGRLGGGRARDVAGRLR